MEQEELARLETLVQTAARARATRWTGKHRRTAGEVRRGPPSCGEGLGRTADALAAYTRMNELIVRLNAPRFGDGGPWRSALP